MINKAKQFEWLAILSLTLLVSLFYYYLQPQIIAGGGKGWDGASYHELYQYYKNGWPTQNIYPFCKRVGLPWLAAKIPVAASVSFLYINLVSGFFAIVIAYATLRLRGGAFCSAISILPLLFYLFSPIRFPNYYPFTVDPPSILLLSIAAYAIVKKKYIYSLAALSISCLFREAGLYYMVTLIVVLYLSKSISTRRAGLYASLALFTIAFTLYIKHEPCSGSQIIAIVLSMHDKFGSFNGVLKTVAAISLTLAPFVMVNLQYEEDSEKLTNHIFITFLFLSLFMAVFGGSDTTRIFFVGFPLYVPFLAKLLEKQSRVKVLFFSFAGLAANSFMKKIPEPENYNPFNDISGLFSLFPEHGHIAIAAAIVAYWLFLREFSRHINWGGIDRFFSKLKSR